MTFGSGLAGSSAWSSSALPFLKLLMPWATSPISSEILPRPNRSTNSTSTIRMCDQLSPILDLPRADLARSIRRHYGSKGRPVASRVQNLRHSGARRNPGQEEFVLDTGLRRYDERIFTESIIDSQEDVRSFPRPRTRGRRRYRSPPPLRRLAAVRRFP